MEYKINIPWRDYQKDTIRTIINSDKGLIHIIKSPRQCGKTTVLVALLLYVTINNSNACSIFVEPTNKQCKKVFREVRKAVESTPVCVSANESTLDITFTNGSQILFISGESDVSALQGFVCSNGGVLIIDEGAFIYDNVMQALFPTTDVHKAVTIIASTPRFRAGTFYDYFLEGLTNKTNIITHDWAGFTLLTPEKLSFYERTLPKNVFRNYYLGEFTDFGTGVFGDISTCISNDFVEPLPSNKVDCYFGIDWGTGQSGDETAVTVFNSLKQMIHIEGFNNLDSSQTIDKIAELVKEFRPKKVQVELNSIGRVFFELLQKKLHSLGLNVSVVGFNTTNDSKNRLVNNFQVAIQNHEVTILNDEKLIYQLNTFECKPTATGKVTYAAAKNGHDDRTMSTLLAFNCISSGSYNIM